MQGREPSLTDTTYSNYKSWGSVPRQKPIAMQPKYRISEADKFDPTQFEKHQLTFPVHTEEVQAMNLKPQTFLKAKDDRANPDHNQTMTSLDRWKQSRRSLVTIDPLTQTMSSFFGRSGSVNLSSMCQTQRSSPNNTMTSGRTEKSKLGDPFTLSKAPINNFAT